jgi:hypothetical protein
MRTFLCRTAAAVLAGAGLAGLVSAQPPPPMPLPDPNVPAFNPASAVIRQPGAALDAQTPPVGSLRSTVPIFNPAYPNAPGGWGGWGGGSYGLGLGGYLQGAANLTVANAQYQLTTQQAKIVREQARREAIETRRATLQQQEYERNDWLRRIDPETQHQKDLDRALRRSMGDPPSSEIWAGIALNALLKDIQNAQTASVRAPGVPLDPEWLPHINVTTGVASTAGVGMLKDLTKFNWPLPLRKALFQKERAQIEEMTRQAVAMAPGGNIDADLLDKLNEAVGDLEERIRIRAPDMTPTQVVQSTRYVHELKDSLRGLQDPNVANYFNGKWKAEGNTVAELVANMTGQGLKFAPATSGDEPTYTVLHRAMVTYVYRLKQVAGQ